MHRVVATIAIALAGCGRLGFDTSAAPIVVSGAAISGFDLGAGGTVFSVGAAALPDGYAVGFVRAPASSLFGVAFDTSFTPNRSMPDTTSPLTYSGTTLAWDGVQLLGTLQEPDGNTYLKTLALDMSQYLTADEETGAQATPSFSAAGATWFGFVTHGVTIDAYELAADGTPAAAPTTSATSGSAITASTVASSGTAAVVVWSATDGSCSIAAMSADLQWSTAGVSTSCAAPYASSAAGRIDVAYETGASIALRSIAVSTATPPAFTIGAERVIATGSTPRLFATSEHLYLAWTDASLELATVDAGLAPITIDGLPPGVPDGWAVAADPDKAAVFAVWGTTVYAISL